MIRAVLLALLLLAGGAAQAERFAERPLILTDGRSDGTPAPLVVVLHGFTATGAGIRRRSGFDAVAAREGILVAYPGGIARRWNAGTGDGPDDVAYLTALIDALVAQGRADPAQIYLAGHSNGGAMALRMACARPDLLTGIAVVAMTAPRDGMCADAPPLPALFIHGNVDPIVPPEGLPASRGHGGFLSVTKTLGLWATRNRCTGTRAPRVFDQIAGPQTARITAYTGCAAALRSVTLTGHGHEWPGAGPRARLIQGPASQELDAAPEIWRFFARIASSR